MSMKQKSSQNIRTVSHLSYGYVFDVFLKNMNEKSMRRFYKNDNALGIDIAIEEEIIRPFMTENTNHFPKINSVLLMGKNFSIVS